MNEVKLELDEVVLDVMHTCALRFDAYGWLTAQGKNQTDDAAAYLSVVVAELRFHESVEENFMAFFALQRCIYKWGGDRAGLDSPEQTAFRFLFLHLHTTPTPAGFEHEEYEEKWRKTHPGRIQDAAMNVREVLLASALRNEFELPDRH